MPPSLKTAIEDAIREATGTGFRIASESRTSGGCINETFLLRDTRRRFFVKLSPCSEQPKFQAEAEALQAIRHTHTIRAPRPIAWGEAAGQAFLVLEAIEFGPGHPEHWAQMGRELAALHRHTSHLYGWHCHNTIGRTPQINTPHSNWAAFFCQQRLRPQLERAHQNGYRFAQADALLHSAATRLDGHQPEPALLHGDLWSGNAGFSTEGTPLIYDPACYYGDRETDLAFSQFFGGFPPEFYQSYRSTWPLALGYEARINLYNLYHALNHTNLFGGNYASQAASMIAQLLR